MENTNQTAPHTSDSSGNTNRNLPKFLLIPEAIFLLDRSDKKVREFCSRGFLKSHKERIDASGIKRVLIETQSLLDFAVARGIEIPQEKIERIVGGEFRKRIENENIEEGNISEKSKQDFTEIMKAAISETVRSVREGDLQRMKELEHEKRMLEGQLHNVHSKYQGLQAQTEFLLEGKIKPYEFDLSTFSEDVKTKLIECGSVKKPFWKRIFKSN